MEQDKEDPKLTVKSIMFGDKPKQHPILKRHGKWILPLSLILNIAGMGIYVEMARVQHGKSRVVNERRSQATRVEELQENSNNSGDKTNLIEDLKSLNPSKILVSDSETQYAVYTLRRHEPLNYSPYGRNGGNLIIRQDLIILNLETGERNVFEVYEKLIPKEVLTFLEGVLSGINYYSDLELLRWSPFSKNTFWGKLSMYSGGDPPIADRVSYFKIDLENSSVDNYVLPSHGLFGNVIENTNAGKVLYEVVGEELSLYQYDLESKQDRLIVTYDKETFNSYCRDFNEYLSDSYYDSCGRERQLRAEWTIEGLSYFDFVTRERIVVNTD